MSQSRPPAMQEMTTVALRPKHLRPRPPFGEPIAERTQRTLKVAIFEDCPEVLEVYLKELRGRPGIEIVNDKTVHSVEEALNVCQDMKPDVVIADLNLDKAAEGFGVKRHLHRDFPNIIVVLSTSVWSVNGHEMPDKELERRIQKECFAGVFHKSDLDGIKWALDDINEQRFGHPVTSRQ